MSSAIRPTGANKTTVIRVVFTFFLLFTIVFIFANSSQAGPESAGLSARVTALINRVLARLGLGFTLTEALVRKLGHFAEFALLGFWLMLTLRVYTRHLVDFLCWPLLLGLAVAVLDEFYQSFVPGRGSSVIDVGIDFAGVLAGLCLALFLQLLVGAVLASARRHKGG